jgi:hypothetical protein
LGAAINRLHFTVCLGCQAVIFCLLTAEQVKKGRRRISLESKFIDQAEEGGLVLLVEILNSLVKLC